MTLSYVNTIRDLDSRIRMAQEEPHEHSQHIDELDEEREYVLYEMAEKFGLDTLLAVRSLIDMQLDQENVWQKEAYELQKNRYTSCKKQRWFSPEDREYIEYFKNKNEEHKNKFCELCNQREGICRLINAISDDDVDW